MENLNRPDDNMEENAPPPLLTQEIPPPNADNKQQQGGLSLSSRLKRGANVRKRRDKKIVGLKDATVENAFESGVALEEEEHRIKKSGFQNPFWLMMTGLYAALQVFIFFLLTLETIIVLALTIGMTLFWYFEYRSDPAWGARYMDWFIVGFAIVGPMSASLTMSFNRREGALLRLSQFRSYANHIYLAHVLWDWDEGNGRANSGVDWVVHTDKVMAQLIGMGDELSRFLRLPTATRSRHRMTKSGRVEAAKIMRVGYQLYESLSIQRLNRLSNYGERIKMAGLGSSEVSRIRQYERWLGETIEALRQVKLYRTPQTLRSFARIFTIVLPPFYAPTFAALAIEVKSLTVGIIMSIVSTMALAALFESIQVMEDPFVAYRALDGIDVREELEVLLFCHMVETRRYFYPNAPPYPEAPRHPLLKQHVTSAQSLSTIHEKDGTAVANSGMKENLIATTDNDPELGLLQENSKGHHRVKTFEIQGLDLLLDNSRDNLSSADPSAAASRGGESYNTKSRLRLFSNEGAIGL